MISLKTTLNWIELLEKNLKKKEDDDKYERLLNQLGKKNIFLKDEIWSKDEVINVLLESISVF